MTPIADTEDARIRTTGHRLAGGAGLDDGQRLSRVRPYWKFR